MIAFIVITRTTPKEGEKKKGEHAIESKKKERDWHCEVRKAK